MAQSSVNVAASFTTDLFAKSLPASLTLALEGRDVVCNFAGFGQVAQSLLDPQGAFLSAKACECAAANVVFVREVDVPDACELASQLASYSESPAAKTVPLVVVLCPQANDPPAAWCEEIEASASLRITVINECQGSLLPPSDVVFDASADEIAVGGRFCLVSRASYLCTVPKPHQPQHIPYKQRTYDALANVAARGVSYVTRAPFKAAVIDCDNTLWSGVVGEDGPEGVVGNLTLMHGLKRAAAKGLLLMLASKNIEKDVIAAFEAHPEWPLSIKDFVSHRINWQPKSQNVASLLGEVMLSKFSDLVFVDDNNVEIAEVSAGCPGITCLNFPAKASVDFQDAYSRNLWPLDCFYATNADVKRKDNLVTEKTRRSERAAATSFADYIKSLKIKIEISACASADEMERVVQLANRTNQFNFTTERIQNFPAEPLEVVVARVSDKHGDYGLVGVLIFDAASDADVLTLSNFMMSCRVLGRGVEQRMMAKLGEIAKEHGKKSIAIKIVPTEKNVPARNFLSAFKLMPEGGSEAAASAIFDADKVANVVFDPDHAQKSLAEYETKQSEKMTAALAADEAERKVLPAPSTSGAGELSYHEIAIKLAKDEVEHASTTKSKGDGKKTVGGDDSTSKAEILQKVIASVLGEKAGKVAAEDKTASLMQLGLDSLNAVQIMSELKEYPGIDELPGLADFLRMPTFSAWLDMLQGRKDGRPKHLAKCIFHAVVGEDPELPPLVLHHPMSGLTGAWNKFVRKMGSERDIFTVENPYYSGMVELRTPLSEVVRVQVDAILEAIGDRQFVYGSYSGGAVYALDALHQLKVLGRRPLLFFSVDGMTPIAPWQLGDMISVYVPPLYYCCCCWACCGAYRCCSESSIKNAGRERGAEGAPRLMVMDRENTFMMNSMGMEDANDEMPGFDSVAKDMYDFYRIGYPEGSPVLEDPHPFKEVTAACGPGYMSQVKAYAKYMDDKYNVAGKAEVVDIEKFTKMLQVALWHTMMFFGKIGFQTQTHHGDLPYAVFSAQADHFALHTWSHLQSDNVVMERTYRFEPKAAYNEIWKSGHYYEKCHNICMVHDEFVE